MNTNLTIKTDLLHRHVVLALACMLSSTHAYAACDLNTLTCSGVSTNTDTLINGNLIQDSSGSPATLNNTTTDLNIVSGPGFDDGSGNIIQKDLGAILRNTSTTPGAASTISTRGSNPVVINNTGGLIELVGVDPLGNKLRVIDPNAWTNDGNGLLYNSGVLAGYAAAIWADVLTSSLTVSNLQIDNNVIYLNETGLLQTGIAGRIIASGDFTAAIHANNPLLNVNNSSLIFSPIVSFAGASYTAPTVLDGTQQAANVTAGNTVINNSTVYGYISEVRVVDRNPLLTAVQAANPGLALAYTPADVGPRNSVINNSNSATIGSIFLGSGAHVINNNNASINSITVDQTDAEVVDVAGGVATTLYKVHGDRTFTLNHTQDNIASSNVRLGDVVIHDVAGAVNTINYNLPLGFAAFTNFTANGLGSNILNMHCMDQISQAVSSVNCQYSGNVTGFNTINWTGTRFDLQGQYNVTGDLNLNANLFTLSPSSTLTATNVVIGPNAILRPDSGTADSHNVYNQTMGKVVGNLVNNGNVYLGDATFDITGNAIMNLGSKFSVATGPNQTGLLNVSGTTTFANGSWVVPSVKVNILVKDGESHIVATNILGLPTVLNGNGLVQWSASERAGDLLITADVHVPDVIASKVSTSAINAVDALFSYKGSDANAAALQLKLEELDGINLTNAVERLRPQINDGSIRLMLSNTDRVFNLLDSRMVSSYLPVLRESAVVAGPATLESPTLGKGIWVQGFGDRGAQSDMNGVGGYSVSASGMAMGAERELDGYDNNVRVGFALAYARGNITDSGATVNNRTDSNSYLATLYGSRQFDGWYVNTALGLARNTYNTRRQLLEYSATSQHDSWQFSGRVDTGWPIQFNDNLALIPMASLDYSHLKESGYWEDGKVSEVILAPDKNNPSVLVPLQINGVTQYALKNSPINLEVEGRSFDSIRTGLGGRVIYSLQQPGWGAELELHGLYRHEFGDIAQDSTARFVVGGNTFYSPGLKPVRDGVVLGGSVRLTGDDENDQLTLLTAYDADIRDRYLGQTMSLNLRYDFDSAARYLKTAKARLAAEAANNPKTQLVKATEREITELQQAMQAATLSEDPQEAAAQKTISATLTAWANALSNKSLDIFFNTYAANFTAPDGTTRQQWERKRKTEIIKEPNPAITISDLTIAPKGDHALAVFTQTEKRGNAREAVQKIVDLENKNGRWLIVREDSIAIAD